MSAFSYQMFVLRLFGGLSLGGIAGPVPTGAQQRRRLSLLALLAMAGDRGMSRERVQAYLWPESPADRARHALDQLLYSTRRDLGADAILSIGSELRLNGNVVRPDVWLFDEALRTERWLEALERYSGPLLDGIHLVAGEEFERLVDSERTRRQHDFFGALEALAHAATECGSHSDAVRWWRRRASADPVSAPTAIALMNALVAAGDRAAAVQHARTYERVVRETLGVDADPIIDRLATEIAAGTAQARTDATSHLTAKPSTISVKSDAGQSNIGIPSASTLNADAVLESLPRRRWRLRHLGAAATLGLVLGISPFIRSGFVLGGPLAKSSAQANAGPSDSARPGTRSAPAAANRTNDPEARSLYLRARTSWEKRTKAGLEDAVIQFRLATEEDPTYAAAYTGLADSYAMLGYFGFAPAEAMFAKARAAAGRALELDPNDGGAYAALGQAYAWEHAWSDAERAYLRALELAPDDATVHQWYALLLAYVGRAHEAALHTGHASRLDPLSVQINNMYGMMLYYDGDLEGALRQYDRTVHEEPDSAWVRQNPWVLANFGRVAAAGGRYEQGARMVNRALEAVPGHPRALLDLAAIYVKAGDPDRARKAFALADSTHPHYAVYRAWVNALLGDLDGAFAWLDRVKAWPLPSLVGLSNDPDLAGLRADPRYQKIRKKLGMRSADSGPEVAR